MDKAPGDDEIAPIFISQIDIQKKSGDLCGLYLGSRSLDEKKTGKPRMLPHFLKMDAEIKPNIILQLV